MRYNKREREVLNMKKIFALILTTLLIATVFTACGGSAKNVDLKAVMEQINSTYGLDGLKNIEDTDGLHRYYQIEANQVKQFAAELTANASSYNEVVIVEAVDQSAADAVETQLNARRRSQLSTAKSYDAEQVSMIEGCEVKTNGNFVYLVIGDQYDKIVADIEAAIQ